MPLQDRPDAYRVEELRQAFASDPRTSELGVEVKVEHGKVILSGVVATEERRVALGEIAQALLADHQVHNDTVVEEITASGEAERLS